MDNAYQGMENGIKPILHSLLAVYTLSMTASMLRKGQYLFQDVLPVWKQFYALAA